MDCAEFILLHVENTW